MTISIDPFVRHARVCDWKSLIWSMEVHATKSVLRNKASNWGSRLKQWVVGLSDDVHEDKKTDEHRRRALLGSLEAKKE